MKTSRGALRRARGTRHALWLLVLALALVMCTAAPAEADDKKKATPSDRLKRWKEDVTKHKKAKATDALKKAFEDAKKLYEDAASDKKLQGKVVATIGTAARGSKDEDLHKAVLFLLSDLKDLRGAKYVKPYLKQPDKTKASVLLDVAVAAAGDLPDSVLVEPLLAIVHKSKHMGILQDAVGALGNFSKVKRKRVKILVALIEATKKVKPGGRPRMRGPKEDISGGTDGSDPGAPMGREGGPIARWNALTRSVPRALSKLTGMQQNQITDWFVLLKDNKSNLKSLFTKD